MSRIKAGEWGILCSSEIRKLPVELHQPLILILLHMDCLNSEDAHHQRRLLEVNIPRGDEKYIQRVEKAADKKLRKYPDENMDCVQIINALRDVVECIKISQKIKNEERGEDEKKKIAEEFLSDTNPGKVKH